MEMTRHYGYEANQGYANGAVIQVAGQPVLIAAN
jgi:hypothetical protein